MTAAAPTSSRPARFAARTFALLAIAIAGVVVLRLSADALPTTASEVRAWATDTDPVGAALPLLLVALLVVVIAVSGVSALYAILRALGWARAAAALGVVVAPRLRRRIDRMIAVGMLASVISCTAASGRAYADTGDGSVVREPAVSALDTAPSPEPGSSDGIVREPDAPVVPEAPSTDVVVDPPADPPAEPPATPDERAITDPGGVVRDAVSDPSAPTPGDAPLRTGALDAGESKANESNADASPSDETRLRTGGRDGLHDQRGSEPGAGAPDTSGTVRSGEADGAVGTPTPAATPSTYTVASGDNLWAIAATTIAAARRIDVSALTPTDIAPYWAQIVEANRATIRSGNPSLIYAGEVLTMPAPA